ncbi:(2Fe-2S)-binding protein [Pararhizobium sp. BT-229]|uniref:(2Fe-2S)-binding protein n=1 Tax=Pararhizobium sp. BT-229 TaxID=2986923 RepID=UPI0021F6F79C|nr:(2Fe-2S)-binding protein [Pararhizobium sp. BT-229]MCV9961125.1 (2Fe-2S)-binding protein [Pararhizobium sp. BT-229]
MDENPDSGKSIDAEEKSAAVIAMRWQAERFPQVAASFASDGAAFLAVTEAWGHGGTAIDGFLNYQNRFAAGMDDRTRGAHLIAFYSHHLSIAAGAIYLRTGVVPDMRPDRLRLRFEPYGREDAGQATENPPHDVRRFHFSFIGLCRGADMASAFHDSFVASLTPVVETLKLRTGLSPVAQWRLTADGLAGAFLDIGTAIGEEERAMAAALAIVMRDGSLLSSGELRYERIGVVVDGVEDERVFRLRSGCCLYYRTPGGDFCDVCVLLDDETKKSRLRAHVEHAGG